MYKMEIMTGILLLLITTGTAIGNTGQPIITDLRVVPNISVDYTSPVTISANISKAPDGNINLVEFGIADKENLLGNGISILDFNRDFSGTEGVHNAVLPYAKYVDIGNGILSDNTSIYTASDLPGYLLTRGTFKVNNTSNDAEAMLWFNPNTLILFNITTRFIDGLTSLNIEEGNSTFRAKVFKYNESGDMIPEYTSDKEFPLYSTTGDQRNKNPWLILRDMPSGNYAVYTAAYGNDPEVNYTINTENLQVIIYDNNGDGRIDKNDAMLALTDYFDGIISKQVAMTVITKYFSDS